MSVQCQGSVRAVSAQTYEYDCVEDSSAQIFNIVSLIIIVLVFSYFSVYYVIIIIIIVC